MTGSVAVVGAGVAGRTTAYALDRAGHEATIFEKRSEGAGRTLTRHRDGCTFEVGANYLSPERDAVRRLVTHRLPTNELVELDVDVDAFDATGTITDGKSAEDPRFTYESGLDTLGELLIDGADVDVAYGTRIDELSSTDGGWRVFDDAGADRGDYDAVVLAAPAPQSADLLGNTDWRHRVCRRLREVIASVPFRAVCSVALHYDESVERPYYALVNDDAEHDLGWVAIEDAKPGYVPDGESVLLAQMNGEWSAEHYHDADDDIAKGAADRVASVLGDGRLADPDWHVVERWRYALPEAGVVRERLEPCERRGIYFAGDWVAGEARLHAAMRSGLETADAISQSVD